MRLTFCGTGGGPFTAERAASGIVVQHDGRTVMLDCGPGSLRNAMGAGIAPASIEAILLSHVHLDHVLDLATLVYLQRFGGWPLPPVLGPPGSAGVVRAASDFVAATPLPLPVSLAPVTEIAADDEREIAGFRVTSRETPHAPEVIAAARRLEGAGRSIVYTGDTQANPEMLVPLSRGADVLIHEAYCRETLERQAESMPSPRGAGFLNGIRSTHTEVEDAARIAAAAGVRILVLTHLLAHEDAALLASRAATHFPGEIVAACDGLVLETA